MNDAARLGAFGLVLVIAAGGGAAVGNAVGPIDDGRDATHGNGGPDHGGHADDGATPSAASAIAGLSATDAGYTLVVPDTVLEDPAAEPFTFRITGPDGEVVTDFERRHERDLHLIVVPTDLSAYTHVHPTMADDGTWSIVLGDQAPGVHRVYADLAAAGGPDVTLGIDVTVPGSSLPTTLAPPSATAVTDGGYEVALAGTPAAGSSGEVVLTVSRDGQPVADLEPYLGAFGHLVAVRSGDLAYLHVHPTGAEPAGPDAVSGPSVAFEVEMPAPGDYRLFFEFVHDGQTYTAAFTLQVGATGAPPAEATLPGHDDDHIDAPGAHG